MDFSNCTGELTYYTTWRNASNFHNYLLQNVLFWNLYDERSVILGFFMMEILILAYYINFYNKLKVFQVKFSKFCLTIWCIIGINLNPRRATTQSLILDQWYTSPVNFIKSREGRHGFYYLNLDICFVKIMYILIQFTINRSVLKILRISDWVIRSLDCLVELNIYCLDW